MPHLVILYTPNLDGKTDMTVLCRSLASIMLALRDGDDDAAQGKPIFPPGGIRVLAYPAAHYAVADGGAAGRAAGIAKGGTDGDPGNYAFVYLNLRMGAGRPTAIIQIAGDAILTGARAHFDPLLLQNRIGITLQIDEGQEAFNGKHGNLHALFSSP